MAYQLLTAKEAMEIAIATNDWKLPFMQFVDDFRRGLKSGGSLKLVEIPPVSDNEKLMALIKAIVNDLCYDAGSDLPEWSEEIHWLNKPWFVSEMKSLYAIAIAESPLFFRRNNIFVMRNFLDRC
jgi:hypothetical protein